jgi:hypothetical protein
MVRWWAMQDSNPPTGRQACDFLGVKHLSLSAEQQNQRARAKTRNLSALRTPREAAPSESLAGVITDSWHKTLPVCLLGNVAEVYNSLLMERRIQYAKTGDGVSIAFRTLGEGVPVVEMPGLR